MDSPNASPKATKDSKVPATTKAEPTTKDLAVVPKPTTTTVLAKKESAKIIPVSKLGYLQRMTEKMDQYRLSVAKEALTECNDKFVEGIVYRGNP